VNEKDNKFATIVASRDSGAQITDEYDINIPQRRAKHNCIKHMAWNEVESGSNWRPTEMATVRRRLRAGSPFPEKQQGLSRSSLSRTKKVPKRTVYGAVLENKLPEVEDGTKSS